MEGKGLLAPEGTKCLFRGGKLTYLLDDMLTILT